MASRAKKLTNRVIDNELVVLTRSELGDLVKGAVREALEQRDRVHETSEWIGPEEVAEITGYSRRYLAELTRRRVNPLPCDRVGRKLRFRRPDVEDWMMKYGRKT